MRLPYLPSPKPEELGELRIHEAVRDFPEVIQTLERSGVSFPREGARCTVEAAVGDEGLESLKAVVAWRG